MADTPAVVNAALRSFHHDHPDLTIAPLVVLIAAYDEADNIAQVVDEVPEKIAGVPVSLLVIDDGSADDTAEIAASHGALVCRLPINRGHGVALRLGYRIAREGSARYIATLDADGQWNPADLPAMVALLEADQADFVIGSRKLGSTENTDHVRNVGMAFFGRLISTLTRSKITDSSSGLRVMRTEITAVVTQVQPQYQTSELLIGAISHGYRVAEVPTVMRRRISGHSKKGGNMFYGARYTRVVVSTWLRERRTARARERNASTSRS
ncbi:MAG: glycosyltransferase family 2 protein [Mycobacteriales bacterium]